MLAAGDAVNHGQEIASIHTDVSSAVEFLNLAGKAALDKWGPRVEALCEQLRRNAYELVALQDEMHQSAMRVFDGGPLI